MISAIWYLFTSHADEEKKIKNVMIYPSLTVYLGQPQRTLQKYRNNRNHPDNMKNNITARVLS